MNTIFEGIGISLNITVYLTSSIDIDSSHAEISSIDIIKNQIINAFESAVHKEGLDLNKIYATTTCDIKYLIEINDEGELLFKIIEGAHHLINKVLSNSLSRYIDEWKTSPPARWKESIAFKITLRVPDLLYL